MMDELDLLKKDWQRKGDHFPKVSSDEIHQMIWKKSSSIVKWIFIISILEFIIPHLFYLFPPSMQLKEGFEMYDRMGITPWFIGASVLQYSIIFYFMYQFYRRYKEISVLDNAKALMTKILKTKKTVTYYIIASLSFLFMTCVFIAGYFYFMDDIEQVMQLPDNAKKISPTKLKNIFAGLILVLGIIATVCFGGLYYLIYGLLLRKLNRNFRELKKMEL
jgi:hypothetical protein